MDKRAQDKMLLEKIPAHVNRMHISWALASWSKYPHTVVHWDALTREEREQAEEDLNDMLNAITEEKLRLSQTQGDGHEKEQERDQALRDTLCASRSVHEGGRRNFWETYPRDQE